MILHIPLSPCINDEQAALLREYIDLLSKWNRAINLVSASTLSDAWNRHIIDSAQLLEFIDKPGAVLDMGSGAGLPGIVMAVVNPDRHIILVEADSKKASFLLEVKRRLSLDNIDVLYCRLEFLPQQSVQYVTARALASLNKIFSLAHAIVPRETTYLLLKGDAVQNELSEAQQHWTFECELFKSITSPKGCIVRAKNVTRRA